MANKRRLKKSIATVTGELFADCVALSLCGHDNEAELKALMADILATHNEYVARLSHIEKGSERLYIKKLREEFTDKVNELTQRIVKA